MVTVHNLDHDAVARMIRVDLASLDREPESPIGNFSFRGCAGGVAAFKGRPPWEYHGQGDEILFILAGESELTVVEKDSRSTWNLSAAHLAIVPRDHWHSTNAPGGVTMLWITPREGNEHSWEEPSV
jgi:mannose-6-phosphate isomerase-like protein (cupin superfamily)